VSYYSHVIVFANSLTFSFSFHGLGQLFIVDRLNMETYAEFLGGCVLPYIAQHYDDGNVLLLHDNHPVHNSNFVKEWITANIGIVEDFVIPHPR
jgi:hypothetical protein